MSCPARRSFWDEPVVIAYWYPRLARRAGRALVYLSLAVPGFLLSSHTLDPYSAPQALNLLLLALPALALATLRPRYTRASVLLCLLGALLSGVLAAALWAATPLPHVAAAAREWALFGEPFVLPGTAGCAACAESVTSSLTLLGVGMLCAATARVGWLAAYHEECVQQTADRRGKRVGIGC